MNDSFNSQLEKKQLIVEDLYDQISKSQQIAKQAEESLLAARLSTLGIKELYM